MSPRQPSVRKVAELALVFLCGGVVLFAAARRGLPPAALAVESPAPAASESAAAEPSSEPPAAEHPAGPEESDAGAEDLVASCAIPDRGLGKYGAQHGLPQGTMIAPPVGDHYDLLLHLHGGEAVRRVLAPEDLGSADGGLVIATVDAGVGSKAYAEAFYGPEALEAELAAVGEALAPAVLRHLIVSSWSAGYGGVREILLQHPSTASAFVLLDSVHSGYGPDGKLQPAGLEPFVSLAERAQSGDAVMVLTHSEIQPPNFAATHEVADYLLEKVGGRRSYAGLVETFGVEHKTSYEKGGLIVRGYTGTDKGAHCAHLRMLAGILANDVLPRLKSME